jgi:hypothetical protein
MKREASRRWSSGIPTTVPDAPTCFEVRVQKLGLAKSPNKWAESKALRSWVKANRKHRYVPESVLESMGLMGFYEGD